LRALDGDDLRKKPFSERKAALRKILKRTRGGIQYVEHTEGDGAAIGADARPNWNERVPACLFGPD
jgi:ATP-dependent DNA ligase